MSLELQPGAETIKKGNGMKRDADFAGFMGETVALVSDNLRFVAIYVLLVGGLNAAGIFLGLTAPASTGSGFQTSLGAMASFDAGLAGGLFSLGVGIVSIVAAYFLLSKLLESRGRLVDTDTRIWAYVGMMILSILGMMIGFLLLVIPGLILLVRWSASSGFLIGGKRGVIESLGDSWAATRGKSWPIFFVGLVLFIGFSVISGTMLGAIGATGLNQGVMATSALINAFSSAVFYALGVAIYYLVQNDEREIGAVFE